MENFLRSKEYWNLIETGYSEPGAGEILTAAQKKTLDELKLKDLKVKNYLFQSIDKSILKTILQKNTSKQIWESMKRKFQGNARVQRAQLQALRRDFEILEMKVGEESKDIDSLTVDELQSSLVVHEQKFRKRDNEEHALKISLEEKIATRGRGRNNFRGRGRGRGRQGFNRATVECYKCHKLEEAWFLDSGCSNHMCGNKSIFSEFDDSFRHVVRLGNNTKMNVHASILYTELKNNLLSLGQLRERGLAILIGRECVDISSS
ncbi:hypothetical protein DH2020_049234 [Rehmannia glutinosa]|uniref:Retrovirus-related Pol polyprotein from transposon TNT 1-94-like beta-barrel domain-containing protein n=1 Tax=Rehmannia glutinosa TaxID=99300 RepID=A0ABR0U3B0_REHGL